MEKQGLLERGSSDVGDLSFTTEEALQEFVVRLQEELEKEGFHIVEVGR